MEDCIFCKIVKGEIPSYKLYENDKVLALLDAKPVNIGHSLVIPKEHYPNIFETPEEIMCELMRVAKHLSLAIKESMQADGINVTMNNHPAAGQVIFHSHVHVIPRKSDDGFGTWKGRRDYHEGEKEEVAQKITKAL
ncbi:MAG TPA: HIT family protein [Candidatus Paceibacterota bacterium]|nr:HIT family protein [Candidatus Paceibacterota bacterium]